ncbi:response regulator [Pseudomonas sp. DC3000-4b1]|uniref:response regulator n=1 Tax=unclassified Pseudomonas TaxID=196821 RepID=UPI003CF590BD
MATAVIIDDQPYIRLMVGQILQEEGIELLGECADGVQGLALIREAQPDIAVLELTLPNLEGLEVIERARRVSQATKWVVLTACPADYTLDRCLRAGITAFVPKAYDTQTFRHGIRAVKAGFTYYPDLACNKHQPGHGDEDERIRLSRLSARELTVLRYLAVGFTNVQIGQALMLSNKTVSSYKTRLVNKLKVQTLVGLAELARRHGLI